MRSDKGSVSVLAIAAILILSALTGMLVDMGAFTAARARAHSAADAAALAACQEIVSGGDPGQAARAYAAANGASVTQISVGSDSVTVTVTQACDTSMIDRLGIRLGPVSGRGKAEVKDIDDADY